MSDALCRAPLATYSIDQHHLQLTNYDNGEDDELCGGSVKNALERGAILELQNLISRFHDDCTPSVDQFSMLKLGSDVRADVHGCSAPRACSTGQHCLQWSPVVDFVRKYSRFVTMI